MNIIKFKYVYFQLLFIYCESKDMSNRKPTKCETCKLFSLEFNKVLRKLHDEGLVEKNFDYEAVERMSRSFTDAELILYEATHMACRKLLDYHIHPKNRGSSRYANDIHPNMDIKYKHIREGDRMKIEPNDDKWEVGPLEIMNLKKACDNLVDLFFEDIEDWYNEQRSKTPIVKYLCENIVLKKEDKSCLNERHNIYKKEEL